MSTRECVLYLRKFIYFSNQQFRRRARHLSNKFDHSGSAFGPSDIEIIMSAVTHRNNVSTIQKKTHTHTHVGILPENALYYFHLS